MIHIEEILGFGSTQTKDSENVTRKYYVRDAPTGKNDSEVGPDVAKAKFEAFAKQLSIPDGMELGEVALDEEKNANNLYFGTITFKKPDGAKIKKKIAADLEELYGEKLVEGRKSATHERNFRVKGFRGKTAQTWASNDVLELASDLDVGINIPSGGFFKDPATENIAPDGIEFNLCQSQEEAAIVESLMGGETVGIWIRQTILDGTQARNDLEGDVFTSYF